jgi:hypothetical protein
MRIFQEVGVRYKERILKLDNLNHYCVNVGASDGVDLDILHHSFMNGFTGLAIEPMESKYNKLCENLPHVTCVHSFATPDNILQIFEDNDVPIDVDAIDVDIDGYDFYVARKILSKYRPKIISIEINQMIPPGVLFSVLYDPDFFWSGTGAFYGCSIDMACLLCDFYDYSLLTLDWIELFFVHNDHAHLFESTDVMAAYKDGYWHRLDKQKHFHWEDSDYDPLSFTVDEMITKLQKMFAGEEGKYFLAPTNYLREYDGLERQNLGQDS